MSLFSWIVGDPVADKQKAHERLNKAAGIGTVNMVCHPAIWHFISVRLPLHGRPEVVHDETMVKATLSGRTSSKF